MQWKRWLMGCGAVGAGTLLLCAGVLGPCWRAWLTDGILPSVCPDGNVRPVAQLSGYGLGRTDTGEVRISAQGYFVPSHLNEPWSEPIRRFDAELYLVYPDGKKEALSPKKWRTSGFSQFAELQLPSVPDGDYKLRAELDTPAGPATVESRLPLYKPALAHVLSDAPLYKPGQTMKFRAVLLDQHELKPLEERPMIWRVLDPTGDVVLEEKSKTGRYGVAASTFPLDNQAANGTWKIQVQSGDTTDEVAVEVRPFQLPRYTVEAQSAQPWWGVGETPEVNVTVRYTSGAPVANAPVAVRASASGAWPPPNAWLEEQILYTDRAGRLKVPFSAVPADLVGQASVRLSLKVTDETGDTQYGSATVQLSAEPLVASAVTELEDGLVAAANNRIFVRVTTPDGTPLPNQKIRLRRAWDASDPGVVVESDADAVARFQVDPGQPITVVEPALPVRAQKRDKVDPVVRTDGQDLIGQNSLDLGAIAALDRLEPALEQCAWLARGAETVGVILSVGGSGQVEWAQTDVTNALGSCVTTTLKGLRAPAGGRRLWRVAYDMDDGDLPELMPSVSEITGSGQSAVQLATEDALRGARRCLAGLSESADMPELYYWELRPGSAAINLRPYADPALSAQLSPSVASCIQGRFKPTLDAPANNAASGLLRISARVSAQQQDTKAAPRTWPGFDYIVALADAELPTEAHLRLRVGEIPPLRLRLSDVIVDPGATVELSALRGPSFNGTFPKKLQLMQADHKLVEFDFDPERRVGSFTVPTDASGFASVELNGLRAVLYIRPQNTLTVDVAPSATTFRPGETASLTVTTRGPAGPVPAGVTLSGVDSTLGVLATLPGADDFARVTVRSKSNQPAFGLLDARALQTGLIRGESAAQAAVLRLSELPPPVSRSERVQLEGTGVLETEGELADAFFGVYAEVRKRVRAWEESAPAGEVLTPPRMMALWAEALKAHPAEDSFGRTLYLHRLPARLLVLTDPRNMVADATRLPEDVENWANYVARESR